MRIAIDCHTLEMKFWAGKEKFLMSILEEFKKRKDNEFILYFRKKVFDEKQFPKNFIIVKKKLPTPFWHFFVLFNLLKKRAEILLSPCAYLLPVLNFFTANIIVIHDLTTFLSGITSYHKKNIKFKERLLLGQAAKNSKKIIAVSESTKRDCINILKLDKKKIIVCYLAAHPRFNPQKDNNIFLLVRKKYDLPESYILFTGTIEPRKNIIGLIKAYALLKDKVSDSPKLVITGKRGWYWQGVFETVKDLGLGKEVVFTGYVSDTDLPEIYRNAKFFVYPSFYEGFGLPILEAMACGCPVITSNISSMPEAAGENAILINPKNIRELADRMIELNDNPEKRAVMKEAGVKWASYFAWSKTADKIISEMEVTDS